MFWLLLLLIFGIALVIGALVLIGLLFLLFKFIAIPIVLVALFFGFFVWVWL